MKKKVKVSNDVIEVQQWFERSVKYKGEAYTIDDEQAAAVVDTNQNTIVVARAGSGKTRTIVAKIVYLIARCGMEPESIMVFVFNANAAAEINTRLALMMVDGAPVIKNKVEVANTFHAFARKIVYDVCGGKDKCGKILAAEKEEFVLEVVRRMLIEPKWVKKAWKFVSGEDVGGGD